MKKTIRVEGMHCTSCEMLLSDVVSEIAGVDDVRADFRKGILTISADGEEAFNEAKKAIEKEGYKVVG